VPEGVHERLAPVYFVTELLARRADDVDAGEGRSVAITTSQAPSSVRQFAGMRVPSFLSRRRWPGLVFAILAIAACGNRASGVAGSGSSSGTSNGGASSGVSTGTDARMASGSNSGTSSGATGTVSGASSDGGSTFGTGRDAGADSESGPVLAPACLSNSPDSGPLPRAVPPVAQE
jgi:hypothetical protein